MKGQQSSRVLETLVARLKSQLTSKDKRIGQLKDAIRDLEKKLGDSFTQRSDASADAASTTSERAVVKAGVENKAAVLGAKLKRTQDALVRYEQKEMEWMDEKRGFLAEKRAAQRRDGEKAVSSSTPRPSSVRAVVSVGGNGDDNTNALKEASTALSVERERCVDLSNRVKVLTAHNGRLDRALKALKEEEADAKVRICVSPNPASLFACTTLTLFFCNRRRCARDAPGLRGTKTKTTATAEVARRRNPVPKLDATRRCRGGKKA